MMDYRAEGSDGGCKLDHKTLWLKQNDALVRNLDVKFMRA